MKDNDYMLGGKVLPRQVWRD